MNSYRNLLSACAVSLALLAPSCVDGGEPVVVSTNKAPRNEFTSSMSLTGQAAVTVLKYPRGGIGVLIGQADSRVYVRQVVAGTPAWNAGVREGDVIIAIGSQAAVGAFRDIALQLRGEVGSKVELTLARPFPERTFKVTLTRAVIKPPRGGFSL